MPAAASDRSPTHDEIERAAAILRAGGVVAFPTETVYGLAANALDARAVERVYRLKGRPSTSPLIVHVASPDEARELAAEWPAEAERLAAELWPGPLTLIVRKAPRVPDAVTAGLPTVGLRVPGHPVALALLAAAGVPLAAPSANPFTRVSATRAEHVRRAFPEGVDAVLDGGRTRVGIESTVVSLVGPAPRLLRHGAVSLARLRAILGQVDLPPSESPDGPHAAPGMHARHYSPRTRLVVLDASAPPPAGNGVRIRRGEGASEPHVVRLPADAPGYAARLYETLHDLDDGAWDWIAVDEPPATADWDAVRDRLERASERAS